MAPARPGELAHYARAAFDIQYEFPFGWQEIEGIHNRGDFDLGRHQEFSGKKLEYFDQAANERYLPYIVETSAGADRVTLTLLVDAYREEEVEGETRVVLGLHPAVAPIKAGVFPLVKKDGMPELATALYHDLKRRFPCSTTTAAPSAGGTGGWTRPARRSASPSTARPAPQRTVTVRHRDSMQQERIGLDQVAAYVDGAARPGLTPHAPRRLRSHGASGWPTRCRREFLDGVAEIVGVAQGTAAPRARRASTRSASAFRCLRRRAAVPRASRAESCCTTARSRRSRTVTPGFDWQDEALETLTHELRHHLEWRARAPDLEDFDWAVEQNFARQDGEAFDPAFYLSGAPVGDDAWRVEDDVFLDRIVGAVPGAVPVRWGGREYQVPVPAEASLPAFLILEGVADPPAGELVLVVRRKPGMLALLRPAKRYHAAVRVAEPTGYVPGTGDGGD